MFGRYLIGTLYVFCHNDVHVGDLFISDTFKLINRAP